jgi:P27 family predicted phage terminase small subunit
MANVQGIPRAPGHLRPETRKWWRAVASEWDLSGAELMLLTAAAETWDRITEAREIIDAHGLTFDDRFGQPKARPEVAMERLQRLAFSQLIKRLGLEDEVEPPPTSRRPRRH